MEATRLQREEEGGGGWRDGGMEVELGQWRRLVIPGISRSLIGLVDGRSVLSGAAADARERVRSFRSQLSPGSPGNLFPPTSTVGPPAEVVPQHHHHRHFTYFYFLIYVPEDSARCSRALCFNVVVRGVLAETPVQFLTVNSSVVVLEEESQTGSDWDWADSGLQHYNNLLRDVAGCDFSCLFSSVTHHLVLFVLFFFNTAKFF